MAVEGTACLEDAVTGDETVLLLDRGDRTFSLMVAVLGAKSWVPA